VAWRGSCPNGAPLGPRLLSLPSNDAGRFAVRWYYADVINELAKPSNT
jgi:hypothetical protein